VPLGRVLVVDDEPEVVAILREALIQYGYVVRTAASGPEALGLMPLFRPDVVLLDVLMPVMPGELVLGRLRMEYPDVAVVMVTGLQDEDRARQLLAHGAFDYVRKPFDLQVLERVVSAAVARRSG
jgi:two-component system OmpR family response regulator